MSDKKTNSTKNSHAAVHSPSWQGEQHLKTIMDSVQSGIIVIDAETRQIVEANPAALQMLGVSKSSVLGSVCHQFVCPAAQGQCPICDLGQTVDNSERVLLTAHGKTIPIMKNVVTITLAGRQYLVESFVSIAEQKEKENELRKLSRAVEQSASTVVVTDTNGNIEYVNPRFIKTTGYTKEEVLGRHTRILKSGETSSEEYKQMWELLTAGHTWRGEFYNKKKNGDLYWESATISPVKNGAGEITNFLAVKEDITERKQMEDALISERTLLRTLIDQLPDYIYIKDTQGQFLLANVALADLLKEETPDGLVGKSDFDFYPQELASQYYEDEQAIITSKKGLIDHTEVNLNHKTGEKIWTSTTKVPLADSRGDVFGLVGISKDITERIETEEKLRRSEQRLKNILEVAPLPMFISRTSDGVLTYVNKYVSELIGVSYDKLIGQNVPDFYYNPDERQKILQAIEKYGYINQQELLLKKADGTPVWVLFSVQQMDFDGEPSMCVGLSDITQRKVVEAELEKHASELETVAQVGTTTSTLLEVDKLLQMVCDLTKKRFNLYHTHIYLFNEAEDTLTLAAGAGTVGRKMVAQKWSIPFYAEQSLVARVARTQKGVIVNNVRKAPDWLPNDLLPNTYAELAVPMIMGNRLLGVLDVQANTVGAFAKEDIHIYTTLASQVAVALENARLFEQARNIIMETERQSHRLTLLNEIGTALSQSTHIDEVLTIVASKTDEIIHSEQTNIALMIPRQDKFELFGFDRLKGTISNGIQFFLKQTAVDRTIQEMHVVVISDTRDNPFLDVRRMNELGYQSLMYAPLIASGEVLGTLNVSSRKIGAYDSRDENLLLQIASLLASTIESRNLFEQTRARVRREQILREITARVRGSTNPDVIVRTAVRELGIALNRPTFVRLGSTAQLSDSSAGDHTKSPTFASYIGQAGINATAAGEQEGDNQGE